MNRKPYVPPGIVAEIELPTAPVRDQGPTASAVDADFAGRHAPGCVMATAAEITCDPPRRLTYQTVHDVRADGVGEAPAHVCDSFTQLRKVPYADRCSGYGDAIEYIAFVESKGRWEAGNIEYATPIAFCPFCGAKLDGTTSAARLDEPTIERIAAAFWTRWTLGPSRATFADFIEIIRKATS